MAGKSVKWRVSEWSTVVGGGGVWQLFFTPLRFALVILNIIIIIIVVLRVVQVYYYYVCAWFN